MTDKTFSAPHGFGRGSELAAPSAALGGPTSPSGLAVTLTEAPLRGYLTLKADLSDPAVDAALAAAAGLPVPGVRKALFAESAGPETGGEGYAVYWMAPDELLIALPYGETAAKAGLLEEALAGRSAAVVDVSDARAVIEISGGAAREVLAKGAPVDLHPDAFGPGDFRRTRLGTLAVAIAMRSAEPDRFEMFCFRSVGPYLWAWLAESAAAGAAPGVFPRRDAVSV